MWQTRAWECSILLRFSPSKPSKCPADSSHREKSLLLSPLTRLFKSGKHLTVSWLTRLKAKNLKETSKHTVSPTISTSRHLRPPLALRTRFIGESRRRSNPLSMLITIKSTNLSLSGPWSCTPRESRQNWSSITKLLRRLSSLSIVMSSKACPKLNSVTSPRLWKSMKDEQKRGRRS